MSRALGVALVAAALALVRLEAQIPEGLAAALKKGGYVLVMRHASAPRVVPADAVVNPDNPARERQLDEAGRKGAAAMGDALRTLSIPIAAVLTSPTYRARETVRYLRVSGASVVDELGDNGQSMGGVTAAQAGWLRARAAAVPVSGNTLLVTHNPNLARAFPDWGGSVADGETVVLRPDGLGGFAVAARVRIDDWTRVR